MILINHPNHDFMADFCLKLNYSIFICCESSNLQIVLSGSKSKYLFIILCHYVGMMSVFCHVK